MTTVEVLKELRERLPREFCRIRTDDEFWPAGLGEGKPEEVSRTITVQTGVLHGAQKFAGPTLAQAMAEFYRWHSERSLCGQCGYAIDNSGMCVMDAAHRSYRAQA